MSEEITVWIPRNIKTGELFLINDGYANALTEAICQSSCDHCLDPKGNWVPVKATLAVKPEPPSLRRENRGATFVVGWAWWQWLASAAIIFAAVYVVLASGR